MSRGGVLFVGGTRSGKSGMAQRWAEGTAGQRVYVATATVLDDETASRVARHQLQRGAGWSTVEAPLDLLKTLQEIPTQSGVVLVDCVTMWICNLMERGDSDQRIFEQVEALGQWISASPVPLALVSSEVGQGIVPVSSLGRRYRDVHGETNQILAVACSTVILASCGLPLPLKGTLPESICVHG